MSERKTYTKTSIPIHKQTQTKVRREKPQNKERKDEDK